MTWHFLRKWHWKKANIFSARLVRLSGNYSCPSLTRTRKILLFPTNTTCLAAHTGGECGRATPLTALPLSSYPSQHPVRENSAEPRGVPALTLTFKIRGILSSQEQTKEHSNALLRTIGSENTSPQTKHSPEHYKTFTNIINLLPCDKSLNFQKWWHKKKIVIISHSQKTT